MTTAPLGHAAALRAVKEALYHRAPSHVPATLEACSCAHCLPPDRRALMIATPVRDLPAPLVRDYLDSAHGVPKDPADLRALLPRVLDLLGDADTGFCTGLRTELRRFGAAQAQNPDVFDPQTQALMQDWGRLMLLHHGPAQAHRPHSPHTALALTETLLVGGWPVETVFGALDTLFAIEAGAQARLGFLESLGHSLLQDGHLGLRALAMFRPETAPAVAAALNRLLLGPAVQDLLVLTDPAEAPWAGALWEQAGTLTPGHILAASTAYGRGA